MHNASRSKTKFEFTVRDGAVRYSGTVVAVAQSEYRPVEQTCSILTVVSNEAMLQIHAHQPRILEHSEYAEYLAPAHGFHCIWHAFFQVKR